MQSRHRDIDVDRKCMDAKGIHREWDELGGWDWHIHTIDTIYKTDIVGIS